MAGLRTFIVFGLVAGAVSLGAQRYASAEELIVSVGAQTYRIDSSLVWNPRQRRSGTYPSFTFDFPLKGAGKASVLLIGGPWNIEAFVGSNLQSSGLPRNLSCTEGVNTTSIVVACKFGEEAWAEVCRPPKGYCEYVTNFQGNATSIVVKKEPGGIEVYEEIFDFLKGATLPVSPSKI